MSAVLLQTLCIERLSVVYSLYENYWTPTIPKTDKADSIVNRLHEEHRDDFTLAFVAGLSGCSTGAAERVLVALSALKEDLHMHKQPWP